jgi:hypothetical protein
MSVELLGDSGGGGRRKSLGGAEDSKLRLDVQRELDKMQVRCNFQQERNLIVNGCCSIITLSFHHLITSSPHHLFQLSVGPCVVSPPSTRRSSLSTHDQSSKVSLPQQS